LRTLLGAAAGFVSFSLWWYLVFSVPIWAGVLVGSTS
jgi:hypothetical protein